MKKFTNLAFIGLLSLFMLVGCENPVPPTPEKPEPPTEEPTPPTPPEEENGGGAESTVAGVVKFGINAPSDWTAKFSNPNVKVTPTSGKAGRTDVTIEVDKKFEVGECLISLGEKTTVKVTKMDGAPFGLSGIALGVSADFVHYFGEASGEFYAVHFTEGTLSNEKTDCLKTINVTKCPKLASSSLIISSCDLVDYSGTLIESVQKVGILYTNLAIGSGRFKSVSFKNCKKLKEVRLIDRALQTIDLTGCDLIHMLELNKNKLTSLPLAGLPKLQELTIGENEIESLDVSQNPLLAKLDCTKSPKLKEIILKQGQTINSLKKDDHTVIKYK